MKNINVDTITLEEAYMMNAIYDDINERENQWLADYYGKSKIQRMIEGTKINISILKNRNMTIQDKLSTVIFGA